MGLASCQTTARHSRRTMRFQVKKTLYMHSMTVCLP